MQDADQERDHIRHRGIAAIILPTIRGGATYALDADMSETDAVSYWMASDKETFVAEQDGVILAPTTSARTRPAVAAMSAIAAT